MWIFFCLQIDEYIFRNANILLVVHKNSIFYALQEILFIFLKKSAFPFAVVCNLWFLLIFTKSVYKFTRTKNHNRVVCFHFYIFNNHFHIGFMMIDTSLSTTIFSSSQVSNKRLLHFNSPLASTSEEISRLYVLELRKS